jgi:hypothetical protein
MEVDKGMVIRRKIKTIRLSKNIMAMTEEGECLRGVGEGEHRQCKDHHQLMGLEADTAERLDQEEDIQMAGLEEEADHL